MSIDRRTFLKAGLQAGAMLIVGSGAKLTYSQSFNKGSLKNTADALLSRAVDTGDLPGVIAAVTKRDGTIYKAAFGERVIGQNVAMTTDTVAWIASMTKPLVCTAAMQLVEQGKLTLEAPAARWVPDIAKVQVLEGWDANGQPRTRSPKRAITLRHLLTHTSGFSYEIFNADILRYHKVTGVPQILTCKNATLFTPLVFDPGERWEYGISIDWIGKIVEAVSGKRLSTYMQENIFRPLGMKSTAFKITPDMRARMAKVHHRDDDGKIVPIEFGIPQEPEFELGTGGLYSTAEDYLKFIRLMLNRGKGNGNQVLKPETVALMSRNAIGDIRITPFKSTNLWASKNVEFFPGIPKSWGLSFMINEQTAPTGRSAGSLGWAGFANSFFWIDQRMGIGGIYITQILPFGDVKSLPLFYAFEKTVYQSLG